MVSAKATCAQLDCSAFGYIEMFSFRIFILQTSLFLSEFLSFLFLTRFLFFHARKLQHAAAANVLELRWYAGNILELGTYL